MSLIFKCKDIKPYKSTTKRKLYREETDESGCPYLVIDGEYDEQEEIQSYYDSVRLDKILERLAFGDTSILRPESSLQYGNANLPTDPFEVINLKKDSERKFGELPDEIKKMYNYDIKEFASDLVAKGIDAIEQRYNARKESNAGASSENNN